MTDRELYAMLEARRQQLLSIPFRAGGAADRERQALERELYELEDDLLAESTILCACCNQRSPEETAVQIGYQWFAPECAERIAEKVAA